MSGLESRLAELERRLDPLSPGCNASGAHVLGYGEVSAVLGLGTLPGRVLKRMSGFATRERASAYIGIVERYLATLRELGVPLADTQLVPITTGTQRHVVYVVQPQLDAARFGHTLLRAGPVQEIFPLLEQVLEHVLRVLAANALRTDGLEIAIDAQLSNWHWPAQASQPRPLLIDVGTPFTRRQGEIEVGADLFLAAYPAPVRWWLRRTRAVEGYLDAFFDPRRTLIDLLGNFNKEGAPEKIPAALAFVNDWLARQPPAGRLAPIELEDVRRYYANDAATLALSLRLRRLRRFVDTKLLRRRYDFILPGPIQR